MQNNRLAEIVLLSAIAAILAIMLFNFLVPLVSAVKESTTSTPTHVSL